MEESLNIQTKKCGVLIIANQNKLLSTAIYGLLSYEGSIEPIGPLESIDKAMSNKYIREYSVIVILAVYPIHSLEKWIKRLNESKKKVLLVLSSYDRFCMHYLTRFPIYGLISTESSFGELKKAIFTISHKNLKYISPLLVSFQKSTSENNPLSKLSLKELDVALSIIRGKKNFEIAADLNISQETVSTYKSRIFRKLDLESNADLIKFAYRIDIECSHNIAR